MARNLAVTYPNRAAAGTIDYPYGLFRNVTINGDGTGTPLEATWLNDWNGFFQAILIDANIIPNGTTDTGLSSQYLNGIKKSIIKKMVLSGNAVFESTSKMADGELLDGTVLDDTIIQELYNNGVTVKTQGFHSGSTVGNAKYKFLNLADSAAAGYVDGSSRFQIRSLDVYACLVVENGIYNVRQFGALTGEANKIVNTLAIQLAVDFAPAGSEVYIPFGDDYLDDEIIINKPLIIRKTGVNKVLSGILGIDIETDSFLRQTVNNKACFILIAQEGGYAFNQYGLVSVTFDNIYMIGKSNTDRTVAAIKTDTTVNGGDYHIRDIKFKNVYAKFFQRGIDMEGICYIHDHISCNYSFCDVGAYYDQGSASDKGTQIRFHQTDFGFNGLAASLNVNTTSGDFGFVGCTISDNSGGIEINHFANLDVSSDCSFENNKNGGNGFGIKINVDGENPNTDGAKSIIGNKFLFNDVDIWINKVTTAFQNNDFAFPMLIDGNTLLSPEALRVSINAGDRGFSSQQFVLGASNAGSSNGRLDSAQVSSNFWGNDQRRIPETKLRFDRTSGFTSGEIFMSAIPNGLIKQVRVYLTANASSFTTLKIGNLSNDGKYISIDAQATALNTWQTFIPTLEETFDDKIQIVFSAGVNGSSGVVEIVYEVPQTY